MPRQWPRARGRQKEEAGAQFEPLPKTADSLAEEYGVSSKTIQRDAKFAEEVEANLEWAKADPGTEIQPTQKKGSWQRGQNILGGTICPPQNIRSPGQRIRREQEYDQKGREVCRGSGGIA